MRGQYIDTMMQGSYRAYIESLYNRLVDQRSPIYSVSTYDQRLLHTKRLMLPLSSDGQQVDMVLSRSEEHTSELQSLMRISYAVFCLKKKKTEYHYQRNKKYTIRHNTINNYEKHHIVI